MQLALAPITRLLRAGGPPHSALQIWKYAASSPVCSYSQSTAHVTAAAGHDQLVTRHNCCSVYNIKSGLSAFINT